MSQELTTTWEQDIEEAKRDMTSSAFYAISAGKHLKDAKEKHRAQFGGIGWKEAVEGKGITQQIADQLIQVYEVFGRENQQLELSFFSSTILRKIAAPSVPEQAREEVIERVQDGEKLTVKETEEIIRKAKAEERERISGIEKEKWEYERRRIEANLSNLQRANVEKQASINSLEQRIKDKEREFANRPVKEVVPESTTREIATLREKLRNARIEKQAIADDLARERIAAKERFFEDVEKENQDRMRRAWAQDTRDFINACKQVFVRWPVAFEAKNAFEQDDMQRLSEMIASARKVMEAAMAFQAELNGHMVQQPGSSVIVEEGEIWDR